jgi:hypothetical protein
VPYRKDTVYGSRLFGRDDREGEGTDLTSLSIKPWDSYICSMPASRMTLLQRVTSALIQAVASSGVPPTGS